MAALKRMAAPSATVIRNNLPETVPAAELVPGDIVMLEAGKIVPADMRLIEAAHLKVEEAHLPANPCLLKKIPKHCMTNTCLWATERIWHTKARL